MVKNALGLIEVVGLAAGLEAADAAVKAANIELVGYELTKGGGMVVIKLNGDVGAIKAAVEAGAAAAAKVSKVYATHIIPRPHTELGPIVVTKETVGKKTVPPAETVPVTPAAPVLAPLTAPQELEQAESQEGDSGKRPRDICNLCGDPACRRKKGDPKVTCLHYDKNNKEDE